MSNRIAVANGADPIQQQAAADGNAVQDACNLVAVVGCFHRHLLALHRSMLAAVRKCSVPRERWRAEVAALR